jgi:hypothetical protein
MRWPILRTLVYKELLRHLANRGGIVLALLLVVASLLLSVFGTREGGGGGLAPGMTWCYVDYWQDGPLVTHLRRNLPAALEPYIRFRPADSIPTDRNGALLYARNTAAIQLRPLDGTGFHVWFWHAGPDGSALAPFESWFWRETLSFFRQAQQDAYRHGTGSEGTAALLLPRIEVKRSELGGAFESRSGLATALVLFGLFFVCVYLLPSLTCEERERGVLLAQALSPASAREILASKFLFYPAAALGLAAVLAGTYQPAALARPFFWLALAVAVFGSMGIGLTIASLARTQRAASMGALCYTLAVALLLFICQQNNIPGLPHLALEYHCPRTLHAALAGTTPGYPWADLGAAALLAVLWTTAAAVLFRRCGWQ